MVIYEYNSIKEAAKCPHLMISEFCIDQNCNSTYLLHENCVRTGKNRYILTFDYKGKECKFYTKDNFILEWRVSSRDGNESEFTNDFKLIAFGKLDIEGWTMYSYLYNKDYDNFALFEFGQKCVELTKLTVVLNDKYKDIGIDSGNSILYKHKKIDKHNSKVPDIQINRCSLQDFIDKKYSNYYLKSEEYLYKIEKKGKLVLENEIEVNIYHASGKVYIEKYNEYSGTFNVDISYYGYEIDGYNCCVTFKIPNIWNKEIEEDIDCYIGYSV